MINTEIAWAAGFFDGEGCFQIKMRNYRKTGYQLQVRQIRVGQNDIRPLHTLQQLFGGWIENDFRGRKNRHYRWACEGHKARAAIWQMLPYMEVRADDACRFLDPLFDKP